MPPMSVASTKRAEWIAVPLASAALVVLVARATPLTEHNRGLDSDGVYYAAMAAAWRTPAGRLPPDVQALARTPPWCWRPVVPWLVAHLPAAILPGFRIVSLTAAGLSLALLYALLRALEHDVRVAALGVALYAGVFWTVRFAAYSPCYVDAATQVWIVAALLAMQHRRHVLAALLLAAAVLTREAALVFVPALLVAILRQPADPARRWRTAGLCVVLAAAAFAVPRVSIEPVADAGALDAWLRGVRPFLSEPQAWGRLALAVFSGCGLLPVVTLVRARDAERFLRERPEWLAALLASAAGIFGGLDKARLMLPLLVPLIVAGLAGWRRDLARRPGVAWAVLLLAVALNAALGRIFGPLGSFEDYLNTLVPMHAPGSLTPRVIEVAVVVSIWLAGLAAARVADAARARYRARHGKSTPPVA